MEGIEPNTGAATALVWEKTRGHTLWQNWLEKWYYLYCCFFASWQEASYPTVGSLRQASTADAIWQSKNGTVLELIWIISYQQYVKQSMSVSSFFFFQIYLPLSTIFGMLANHDRQLQAKDCVVTWNRRDENSRTSIVESLNYSIILLPWQFVWPSSLQGIWTDISLSHKAQVHASSWYDSPNYLVINIFPSSQGLPFLCQHVLDI